MRHIKIVSLTLFLFAGIFMPVARPAEMSVQVREAQLRVAPSFLGKIAGTCFYGDKVLVFETKAGWHNVRAQSGQTGWIHSSALTAKKVVLKVDAATAQAAAGRDELSLAGKGFNSDVEAAFKQRHSNIDFSVIDRFEAIKITAAQMEKFLRDGNVR